MFPKIQTLQLLNFKSFRGHHFVGPFEEFTVLVGSNCLGKFQLLDAIDFCLLTERTASLNHDQLPDEEAFVEMSIRAAARHTVRLKRFIVDYEGSQGAENGEFAINGKIMPKSKYDERVRQLHIQPGVPICYDRQSLLNVFLQSPTACTELFERTCGSWQFRGAAQRCADQLDAARQHLHRISVEMLAMRQRNERMRRQYKEYALVKAELHELKVSTCLIDLRMCQWKVERNEEVLRKLQVQLRVTQADVASMQEEISSRTAQFEGMALAGDNDEISADEYSEWTNQLDVHLKCMENMQSNFNYVVAQSDNLKTTPNDDPAFDADAFHQSLLSPNVPLEQHTNLDATIVAIRRFNAFDHNTLCHQFNLALQHSSPDHQAINAQLTRRTHQLTEQLQKEADAAAKERERHLKRVLDNSAALCQYAVGDRGVCLPEGSIVTTQEGLDAVARAIQGEMANDVLVESQEEALELQKQLSAQRPITATRIVVISGEEPAELSGLQMKSVIKVCKKSTDRLSQLFRKSLPALNVTQPGEKLLKNSISTDGTKFDQYGRTTCVTTPTKVYPIDAEIKAMRALCDFQQTIDIPLFAVDEALLDIEPPPVVALHQLLVAGNDTIECVNHSAQQHNALRRIVNGVDSERFDAVRILQLEKHRDVMQSSLEDLNISVAELQAKNSECTSKCQVAKLRSQVEELEARMVGWMDKVSAIEGSINSETECLAKNMAEVYRLLLAAQKSQFPIPLLQGNLDSLTEDVRSVEGIIVDFSSIAVSHDTADIRAVITANAERADLLRCTLRSMKGVQMAKDCFARLEVDYKTLEDDYGAADDAWQRLQLENRRIAKQRGDLFAPFYRHMQTYLPASYAELMADPRAQAMLLAPDTDAPWLEDILLDVLVPARPYRHKDELSEQEAAMAAVVTLFAMRSFGTALPFVVLHEIDRMVTDDGARKLLVEFLVRRSRDRQVIVVSDRDDVYTRGDTVIGVLVVNTNQSQTATMPIDFDESDGE